MGISFYVYVGPAIKIKENPLVICDILQKEMIDRFFNVTIEDWTYLLPNISIPGSYHWEPRNECKSITLSTPPPQSQIEAAEYKEKINNHLLYFKCGFQPEISLLREKFELEIEYVALSYAN